METSYWHKRLLPLCPPTPPQHFSSRLTWLGHPACFYPPWFSSLPSWLEKPSSEPAPPGPAHSLQENTTMSPLCLCRAAAAAELLSRAHPHSLPTLGATIPGAFCPTQLPSLPCPTHQHWLSCAARTRGEHATPCQKPTGTLPLRPPMPQGCGSLLGLMEIGLQCGS